MVIKNIEHKYNKSNFNKVLIFNHNNIQVPISVLEIECLKDDKKMTLGEILVELFDENKNLKDEVDKFKEKVANIESKIILVLKDFDEKIKEEGVI